jgi:hypothetical protein
VLVSASSTSSKFIATNIIIIAHMPTNTIIIIIIITVLVSWQGCEQDLMHCSINYSSNGLYANLRHHPSSS